MTKDLSEFKLCFIEGETFGSLKLYFTEKEISEQWGDDWDDAPYEHNAGTPYTQDYNQKELRVENGAGVYPPIQIETLYLEPKDWKTELITPQTGTMNSRYSVEDINGGAIPWLVVKVNQKIEAIFGAGTTLEDFLTKVENLPVEIYTRRWEEK